MIESYIKDFDKIQEEFYDTTRNYPLYSEQFDYIEDHELKDLDEYIEKFNNDPSDTYYLKKAISLLEDLIKKIKNMNSLIKEFDKLITKWNDIGEEIHCTESEVKELNLDIKKGFKLIKSNNIPDLEYAIKLIEKSISNAEYYNKHN